MLEESGNTAPSCARAIALPPCSYQEKYLWNDTFWAGGDAPIFFYTGNEGAIELFCSAAGFMWELAAKANALIVCGEHRGYGASIANFLTSDLGLFNSEQALADYAQLLDSLKTNLTATGPVVAFGGA